MKASFSVLITRRAERDVEGLDGTTRRRIRRALEALSENPLSNARKLAGEGLGEYRLRVGDWRIIFDLVERDVIILRIGHRSSIYRRR